MVTFRLEWTEDMRCADHKRGDRSLRRNPQFKRRDSSKRTGTSTAYTPEADRFLVELKEQHELSWGKIHQRFTSRFPSPKRSAGSLQGHHCTKLKRSVVEEE